MRSLLAVLLPALALFAGPACFAQVPLPQGVTRATTVEGITEYDLPNGLRVLFAPDASKPTTTVNITYMVGSRHENYGETGMAHLLEHLIFFGTPSFTDVRPQRTKRGMRANGSTWTDRTNYFASWAANDDNLDWFLRWSADAMTHSFIAKKDLDTEMTVVRNEMERGENDPRRVLIQRTIGAAYSWHNYGKSTIGARADVENVNIERLQAFYRKYYQPDNAVLIVAGKFDEAKTLDLIAREFGKIPRPTRVLEPTYTVDPEQQGERSVTIRRVGETQLAVAMYHAPAGPHPDSAAAQLLANVLGETPSGRLHKALVETRQAASVAGGSFAWREPSVMYFLAEVPQTASLDNARATLISAIEETAKNPITDAEVERARTRYLRDFELLAADPERVGVSLSESIALGDWRLFFLRRDRVRNVKTADVQRVADAYLLPDNRTLGLFIPTAAPKRPPAPVLVDVAPMVKDYKGDTTAVATGEAFDATPANIESRTERGRTAEGLRYALLPKKTRGATVNVRLVMRTGDETSLFGTQPAGTVAASMLNRGAAGMTRAQIQEAFDKLKARVSFAGGSTRTTVTIEATRDNLPAVMDLVAKVLRNPEFPAAELESLKIERVTALEGQRKEPDALARDALGRHGDPYPKGHVLHDNSFEESIADMKAVTLDRVRAFHKDFYGIDHADLAAVGDFDSAALKAQLASAFAGFKAAKPYKRVPMPYYAVTPAEQRLQTPDKANAFFAAQARFPLRDDAPDYAAALVANRAIGGGPGSILFQRIRTRDGTSYGVGSNLQASSNEPNAVWVAFAIYAPQNVKKLEDAFREEVGRVFRDGFTEKELNDAKAGLLQSRRLSLAQDRDLAGALTAQIELGRNMDYISSVDRAIEAVTLDQANAAFRKYIDPSKLVFVYAGDFAKGKP